MSQRKRIENVQKEVVYQTVCDACGKVGEGSEPKGWHRFDSHHGDWGNDSIESWDYHDVCSFSCYLEIVRKVVEDYGDGSTLSVDEKDYEFIRGMLSA